MLLPTPTALLLAVPTTASSGFSFVVPLPAAQRRTNAPRCCAVSTAAPPICLLDSYEACIVSLLDEIAATQAGDRIDIGLYLFEGGRSSEAVLAALTEAGRARGVQVCFQLDVSYVSMISRIVEKTDTLVDRVAQLANEQRQWCSCAWGSKPDHGKYACFQRQPPREDSAILGGMNLGDRFTKWDDYAVRLPAPYASQLRASLLEGSDGVAVAPLSSASQQGVIKSGVDELKLGAAAWDASSIRAARTVAIVSPPITLITTLTVLGATFTLAVAPVATITEQPSMFASVLTTTLVLAATAAYLGTAFATAADGGSFSLTREMLLFVQSLVFDRSWLGDRLASLRPLYRQHDAGGARDDADGARDDAGGARDDAGGARDDAGGARNDAGGARNDAGGARNEPRKRHAVEATLTSSRASSRASSLVPLRERRLLPTPSLPVGKCDEPTVRAVCNRRSQRRYEIEPTFRALFSDSRLMRFRITMAYLGHRWGVELLEYALRRGATIALLLPERANVYAHENVKAAQTLLDARWPNLELYLHPEMVHAKAMLAWEVDATADGSSGAAEAAAPTVAFLGSANLVRGSLNLPVHCGLLPYDELNVLIRERAFCETLEASMAELFAQARRVPAGEALLASTEWYEEARAQREELFH